MADAVESYIAKQKSPQREICDELRRIILKSVAGEGMRWGVPTFAGGKCYIVALKDHVNIGFSMDALTEEGKNLIGGSGKTMKHIEIHSLDEIEAKKITKLLNMLKF